MSLIFYKSLKREFKKGFIDINKKLYFFLFYLSLNIKDLLLLSLKSLILSLLSLFKD